jgi:hypothetical protein
MGNHVVETETAGLSYSRIVRVAGENTTETAVGPLGGSNFGYVMPYPRSPEQTGKKPICQQCHEDARHIGDDLTTPFQVKPAEIFSVTQPDGSAVGDSPRFQTFPHEGENRSFGVEPGDDLCLNCHPA